MPAAPLNPDEQPLRFGRFEIRPAERVLRTQDRILSVGARAFDLLLALARRRDRLVTKQELLDVVWPGVIVEEHNIAAQISSLRKLLGADFIATVPGRGYRFTAALANPPDEPQAAAPRHRRDHNLPELHTRFIGREAELSELGLLFGTTRLLTLTGIGGCGKTRLALQFARQRLSDFSDGIWFVDLAPLEHPQRVAPACASVLGIGETGVVPAAEQVAGHLAVRNALIVLDNCEHVRDGAAALADAVLAHPGSTRLLATSREPLVISGEQLYPVSSLSLPSSLDLDDVRAADAVRVFVDRARLTTPEFEIDADNAAALAAICRRLDGIALAIEMAAARVAMLSLSDIAARLEDRFRLLASPGSSIARQQTLLAAMQWSYNLLQPAEQRMLHHLAIFAGGCTLRWAAAVAQAGDDYEALMLLTALHDKSLLLVERASLAGGLGGPPRYRMLETVRQYAQQRLEESGEAGIARERLAEQCLALAEAAAGHLRGPQQSPWMARLQEEHENLVAAMSGCARAAPPEDVQRGLRLAAATGRYWLFHDVQLGSELVGDILRSDLAAADSPSRCDALLGMAALSTHRGQHREGLTHARAALEMAERLKSAERQAIAHKCIGSCLAGSGEDGALQHLERGRDLARAAGCMEALSATLNNIAMIEFCRGDLQSAEHGLRQSLQIARAQGDVRSVLIGLHNLIRLLVVAGRPAGASACAVEAQALLRGIGEDVLKLELLEVVAGLASIRGDHEIAARFWGAARKRITDAGYGRYVEDDAYIDHFSANSRRALGDAGFERAEAAGWTLEVRIAMQDLAQWLERHATGVPAGAGGGPDQLPPFASE